MNSPLAKGRNHCKSPSFNGKQNGKSPVVKERDNYKSPFFKGGFWGIFREDFPGTGELREFPELDLEKYGDPYQEAKNLIPLLRSLAYPERSSPEPELAWTPELLSAARDQKLTPWLYAPLAPQPKGVTPTWVLDACRRDYIKSLAISVLAQEALQEILVCLSQQQIKVIVFKGAYLGPVLYGDAALRPMTDLDLLVPEADLDRAHQALTGLGYRLWCFEPLPGSSKTFGYALGLTRSEVNVDLHWEIRCHGGCYRLPSAALWASAVPGELCGLPVFFLSPEMTLIHLGVHALTHSDSLLHRLDIVLFLQKYALDWDRFLAQAQRLAVMRPLYWFFQELARDWGVFLPPPVFQTLAGYRPRWWEDRALGGRGRRVFQRFIGVGNIPGLRNQVRYLWAHVCPPAGFRQRRYGSRGWLSHFRVLAANLGCRAQPTSLLQMEQGHPQGRVQPTISADSDQLQD